MTPYARSEGSKNPNWHLVHGAEGSGHRPRAALVHPGAGGRPGHPVGLPTPAAKLQVGPNKNSHLGADAGPSRPGAAPANRAKGPTRPGHVACRRGKPAMRWASWMESCGHGAKKVEGTTNAHASVETASRAEPTKNQTNETALRSAPPKHVPTPLGRRRRQSEPSRCAMRGAGICEAPPCWHSMTYGHHQCYLLATRSP
jgi:hypothetical protein